MMGRNGEQESRPVDVNPVYLENPPTANGMLFTWASLFTTCTLLLLLDDSEDDNPFRDDEKEDLAAI